MVKKVILFEFKEHFFNLFNTINKKIKESKKYFVAGRKHVERRYLPTPDIEETRKRTVTDYITIL